MAKITLTNVHVTYTSNHHISVGWQFEGANYHIWIWSGKFDPMGTLFKNPLVDRGQPGYFDTRRLNPIKARNADMIAIAFAIVKTSNLLEKAKAEFEAKAIIEQAETDAIIARRQRGFELFEQMRAYTKNDPALGGWSMSIGRDDMLALLELAPKPNWAEQP